MTLIELESRLGSIADDALASSDPTVRKVAVILAAVMGCIVGGAVDAAALDPMCVHAGLICEHRVGLHD